MHGDSVWRAKPIGSGARARVCRSHTGVGRLAYRARLHACRMSGCLSTQACAVEVLECPADSRSEQCDDSLLSDWYARQAVGRCGKSRMAFAAAQAAQLYG